MRKAGAARGSRLWDAVLLTGAFWVLVLSVWLDVRFLDGILERISTRNMDVHGDFDSFWRSARALLEGGDIYDAGAKLVNLNPPVWTVVMSPLGLLEALSAYYVFVLISLAVALGYLAWTAQEVHLGAGWAVVGSTMLLLSSPMLSTLALGQIYPILTLGLVAAWVADRRDRHLLSGGALGLVVAIKPSLAPILLWPLVRRRWEALGAAMAAGVAATLAGMLVAGIGATRTYLGVLEEASASAYWDNASLPAAAARLFTENPYAQNLVTLPGAVYVAYAIGIGVVLLTAVRIREGPEVGLWALVAASLVASPIAWHNYLVLLAPGVLLLLARGRVPAAILLLALQSIPAQWILLWNTDGTVTATLALTLYLFILLAHWLAFLAAASEAPVEAPADAPKGAGAG